MAQASVELPETSDQAAPSTDDLLSQLAGAEIDRLLAEADAKPTARNAPSAAPAVEDPLDTAASSNEPSPQAESSAAAVPAGSPLPDSPSPDLDQALEAGISADSNAQVSELPESTAPEEAAARGESSATTTVQAEPTDRSAAARDDGMPVGSVDPIPRGDKAAMSAELDQLFNELNATDAAKEASEAVMAATTVPQRTQPAMESSTSSAERAALAETSAPAGSAEEADEAAPLPIYLKPLQWLSAPLQLVPESARELLGKIAIVTFMNSLALLAYLLIFRRG